MDPGAPDVAWNESWQGALDDAVEELTTLKKPVTPKDVLDLMKVARCPADENIPKLYAVCSKLEEYWTRKRRDALQKEGDPASLSARLRAWSVGGPSREEADAALDQMVEGCREAPDPRRGGTRARGGTARGGSGPRVPLERSLAEEEGRAPEGEAAPEALAARAWPLPAPSSEFDWHLHNFPHFPPISKFEVPGGELQRGSNRSLPAFCGHHRHSSEPHSSRVSPGGRV